MRPTQNLILEFILVMLSISASTVLLSSFFMAIVTPHIMTPLSASVIGISSFIVNIASLATFSIIHTKK